MRAVTAIRGADGCAPAPVAGTRASLRPSRPCASEGASEVARSRFAGVLRKLVHPAFDWLMICFGERPIRSEIDPKLA